MGQEREIHPGFERQGDHKRPNNLKQKIFDQHVKNPTNEETEVSLNSVSFCQIDSIS